MSFSAHYRILAFVIFFHMPHPVTLIPNRQVDVLSSKNQALHRYVRMYGQSRASSEPKATI